jgi:hypothetical protein
MQVMAIGGALIATGGSIATYGHGATQRYGAIGSAGGQIGLLFGLAGMNALEFGETVEAILGPPDRLWPIPHPNYVLLYDAPTFFRVELDLDTEKVIAMIR